MLYRYRAISTTSGSPSTGELSAQTPADVRASLRRIGLQAIEVRPVRALKPGSVPFASAIERHLRTRRRSIKAELFDSLATMLEAGIPLEESLTILADGSRVGRRSGRGGGRGGGRGCLSQLRESVRGGEPLSNALRTERSWFDQAEVAMVTSGELSGELPTVLRSLAERHHRAGELTAKLTQTLIYPAIVLLIGLGVAVFLSTNTLPRLVGILEGAQVDPPRLTVVVMASGQALAHWWWLLPLAMIDAPLLLMAARRFTRAKGLAISTRFVDRSPRVIRQAALAEALLSLAELMRVGVPMTDALRVTAPTLRGPVSGALGRLLMDAADRLEHGERISEALNDQRFFDAELIRLIAVGEQAGELDALFTQAGERARRRARRSIDRLASLLEPAVILMLAAFVGTVVMAAVLPLIRLQEVL